MESRDATKSEEHSPTRIVCIYAVRDEPFYRELQTYLVLWQTKGHIRWLEISAGADIEQTLLSFVQQADLILLLISPSFFASGVCHKAMESALAAQGRRSVPVVPLLARASDWKESDCAGMLALPDNELPIAEWEHQERAYENIRAVLARLLPGFSVQETKVSGHPRLFQARDLPRGYISRPKVFDAVKHLLLNRQGNQTTAITTALRGAGGFGKTTLALALCHDRQVQRAFPDGILWVELGEHPSRSLDVLNGVLASLDPSLSGAITLHEAQDRWRKALGERRYLLVIDDVWQAMALTPLLDGGPHCMRLVTTRNDQVLPDETARIFVDVMEREEAISVLCRGLPEEIHHPSFQSTLLALASRLGYWPLLLTLANSMLVAQVRHGRALLTALAIIEQAYETRGVLAFDPGNLTDRQRAVKACIEVSLRHLEEFTSPHYQAVERYQELAVFPEDTDIPLETLRRYWQGTGGLATWEVDDLCMHLHDLSLLLTCNLSANTIRLHDVMRSYLIQRADSRLSALHARFLDVSKQILGISRWADLPAEEHYLWQYLVLHLCEAVNIEELQATLTDLSYLARKVLYMGVQTLEVDLLQASTFEQAGATASAQLLFESLHRKIVQISHLLRHAPTLAEVGGFLLSYLGSEPPFATSGSVFWHELPRPFLTAWHPLPSRSSSALRRTLRGHTDGVDGCAVSPDGRFIASASRDHTLKVWDADRGVELFSLHGHTSWVNDCAFSSDGRWIVSASDDGTLKVWDATTGAERRTLTSHTHVVKDCAFSPDGRWLVSASADETLKLWDVSTWTERLTLTGHKKGVSRCAFSPDGRWIVSAAADHTLKVWDVTTGEELFSLLGHTDLVVSCAVSSDGKWIVSSSWDHTLKVWDATSGEERLTLQGHTHWIYGCTFSPDGYWIVSASTDQTLKVWDRQTGQCVLTLPVNGSMDDCAFHPDGEHLVACGDLGMYFLRLVV